MTSSSSDIVSWLRAAGEPSRLRLLVSCSQKESSVSDLAEALGQSEPRVSRHLRILCESGLLERLRNGQWVHYRLASGGPAAGFVQGLLAQLDRNDPQLRRDVDRTPASESRLGRALKGFMDAHAADARLNSALVVGVEHLELLEAAASMAVECTAIAHSRRAAQSARAFAERRGFNCRVLLCATADALRERDIANAGGTFDAVILDHLSAADTGFVEMLSYGRRALSPAGSMWLFERYESLEGSRERNREKVVEHPLARLRRLLGDLGLSCERLSPIEADGEHVLAAVAVPATNSERPNLRRA